MNAGAEAHVSYPPLNVLKSLAEGLWIVDSEPLHMMGLRMPVRMSVIQLSSGDLWLHSPTRFDTRLQQQLEELGPIRHLVAPNIAHWSFMKDWQTHCPEATLWAAPNLRQRGQAKKAGLRIDHDLQTQAPDLWAGDIEQTIIPGGGGFREVAFFHKSTRTLLLTDLIVNLEGPKLPRSTRAFAKLTGTLAPDGKAPAYLRLAIRMRHREAATAAAKLVAWAPERVIFAHGRWFERDGTEALKHSLSWLRG